MCSVYQHLASGQAAFTHSRPSSIPVRVTPVPWVEIRTRQGSVQAVAALAKHGRIATLSKRATQVALAESPMVYVDSSRLHLVDGFTRKIFTAMIEGVREPAIAAGLIESESFDAGVRALHRTTEADGAFCYT